MKNTSLSQDTPNLKWCIHVLFSNCHVARDNTTYACIYTSSPKHIFNLIMCSNVPAAR